MGNEPSNNIYGKKKVAPRDRDPNGAIFMLRCAELNLSDQTLDTMSMGMVYDMITEKANDHEHYDIKGQDGMLAGFLKGENNGY